MFPWQQLPSQYWRWSHNRRNHSKKDVHTKTAAITAQEMFTWQRLTSQLRRCKRCSHNNSCHESNDSTDVHMTKASITMLEMFTRQRWCKSPWWCKWYRSGLWSVQVMQRPGFESHVKWASQFIKSQTAVSTTEHYFLRSVVCLIVECTWRQRKGNWKKNFQIVVGWLGWKWIERSVLQLLLLTQKVELLFNSFHHSAGEFTVQRCSQITAVITSQEMFTQQ